MGLGGGFVEATEPEAYQGIVQEFLRAVGKHVERGDKMARQLCLIVFTNTFVFIPFWAPMSV